MTQELRPAAVLFRSLQLVRSNAIGCLPLLLYNLSPNAACDSMPNLPLQSLHSTP